MGRKPDLRPLPPHPAIISAPRLGRYCGHARTVVTLRCPECKETREIGKKDVAREMRRPNFKGLCRKCSIDAVRNGTHRWFNYREGAYNTTHSQGYILISPRAVSDSDLPMYRAMQKSGQPVMEHRWVMAKHLGRALTSNECVDHMNGVKTDNRVENLRLYVKGKQQPGSCPAHGTYYDEWQKALRRIRELEAALASPVDR